MQTSSLSLGALFQAVSAARAALDGAAPSAPEYQTNLARALELSEQLVVAVRHGAVFGAGEGYREHGAATLRLVLAWTYRAHLLQSQTPPLGLERADRDALRLRTLSACRDYAVEFLRRCVQLGLPFASRELVGPHLAAEAAESAAAGSSRAGAPPPPVDRDAKIARMRATSAADARVKAIEARLAANAEEDALDELEVELQLAVLESWVFKTCNMLDMHAREESMLQHMVAAAAKDAAKTPAQQQHDAAAVEREARARPPAEPPVTLTKDMVARMAASGTSINRADFQLITRGYGPIGAPTKSLDQQLADDMALMAKPAAPAPTGDAAPDSDTDEQADAATYRARAQDEYKDTTRRGDGNRMGYG